MVSAVSSLGRYRDSRGIVKTPSPKASGYVDVTIKDKHYKMHRLVCAAFHGPSPSKEEIFVDHIDGNPSNNQATNLRWVSHARNIQLSYENNKDRKSNAPKKSKPIKGRKVGTFEWTSYASVNDAARSLSLGTGNVSAVARGKCKQTGGFEFIFDVPNEVELLPGEVWKDVEESKVSSLGRFRDAYGVFKTPSPRSDGYVDVKIKKKIHLMHRLVCEAFHGPPPSKEEIFVDHIDGNPSNNQASNLRWVTAARNIQLSFENNKDRKSSAPKRSKPVKGRKVGTSEWTSYASTNDAARSLSLNHGNVSSVARGELKHTGGFEFEWDEPNEVACLPGEVWIEISNDLLVKLCVCSSTQKEPPENTPRNEKENPMEPSVVSADNALEERPLSRLT